ncbi:hypothetical protein EON77_20965, partial [bacterium]
MGALLVGIRLAFRGIQRNGLRSALTVLGILIGVAAVVIVTALGAGARLTEEDGRAIAREAVSVAAVAPSIRARGQLVVENRNAETQVCGTTLAFFPVKAWDIVKGEAWTEHDEATKAKVLVLGSTVAEKLFPAEDAVGKTVRIGRYNYRVVGVLKPKGRAPFGGDQDDLALMPIGSMRARVFRTPPGFAGVLLVSARSAETTDRAVAQLTSILRQRHRLTEGKE